MHTHAERSEERRGGGRGGGILRGLNLLEVSMQLRRWVMEHFAN